MDGRWSRDSPDMPQRVKLMAGRLAARTRGPGAVLSVIGLVAVVLVSAIVFSLTRPPTPGQAAAGGDPQPPVVEAPAAPSETAVSPSPESTPSGKPSGSAPPKDGKAGDAEDDRSGDSGGDDSGGEADEPTAGPESTKAPAKAASAPSRPEAFGAWFAATGKYTAKWERPADDGGSAVTGYVVRKCSGVELVRVGSGTFRVDVYHSSLTCMTVQAINAKGEGQTAYFDDIK